MDGRDRTAACGRSRSVLLAERIADQNPDKMRHVDIRSPNATGLAMERRDEVMSTKLWKIKTEQAIAIVGESHRDGVARRLNDAGLFVLCIVLENMAGTTGLEPAASAVTEWQFAGT